MRTLLVLEAELLLSLAHLVFKVLSLRVGLYCTMNQITRSVIQKKALKKRLDLPVNL